MRNSLQSCAASVLLWTRISDGLLQPLDRRRHRHRLAGAGGAQQRRVAVALVDALGDRVDRRRLVGGRAVDAVELERRHGRPTVWKVAGRNRAGFGRVVTTDTPRPHAAHRRGRKGGSRSAVARRRRRRARPADRRGGLGRLARRRRQSRRSPPCRAPSSASCAQSAVDGFLARLARGRRRGRGRGPPRPGDARHPPVRRGEGGRRDRRAAPRPRARSPAGSWAACRWS